MVLTLQRNKQLLYAGILAFAILVFSQVSVQAFDFVGNLRSVKTIGIGGYGILTIGNPAVDTGLNIGRSQAVATTQFVGALPESGSVDIQGVLTSMGDFTTVNVGVQFGNTPLLGSTSALVAKTNTGSFTINISGYDTNQTLYYRVFSVADGHYTYGETYSSDSGRSTGFNLLTLLTVVIAMSIFVGVLVFSGNPAVALVFTLIGLLGIMIVKAMLGI